MTFQIVSDTKGRIRFRCGKYAFSKDDGQRLEAHLGTLPYVESVSVSHLSGSILILYSSSFRTNVLKTIFSLRKSDLSSLPDPGNGFVNPDFEFKRELFIMVRNRLICKYLLPAPIRTFLCLRRSLRFLRRGWASLKQGKLGVDVLDGTAVGVSILQGQFTTASSIMFLLSLSELLEEYTRKKTKLALTKSLTLNVDSVWVERDGDTLSIPLSLLEENDRIIVRAGSIIPVDGVVSGGEAMVNQSTMTGESLAVHKKEGDTVFAGTVLEDGRISIQAWAVQGETRINKIVALIDQSEALKANVQSQAEAFADSIVPFSFLLAVGVFLFTGNWRKALSVLLVDYSCAIKLSTPIAVISAMREASAYKIMVKGGRYLEAIAKADTIIFDKTGTLTAACPQVSKVIPCPGFGREEILRTAACLEEHFPHSVARAVVRKAKEEGLRHEEEHAEVEYIVAHGIATTLHGQRAVIGSFHFVFEDEKVRFTKKLAQQLEQEVGGDSVIFLAINGKAAGFLCISDPPRPEAAAVISRLKALGLNRIVMLTGDSEITAKTTAAELGISQYRSQVLPEDKASVVERLKKEGATVAMVGDGINDSPALAAADVSISMRDSSDIAKEVSDITLLSSDLSELITIRLLSQRLMRRIKLNHRFILLFNSALLLLGLSGLIVPNTSALLHNASTMAISAASMRPCLIAGSAGQDSQFEAGSPERKERHPDVI